MTWQRTAVFLLLAGMGLAQSCQAGARQDGGTRYLRFSLGDHEAYGILEGDRVRELEGDLFGTWEKTETTHALADVTILVPSRNPSKVLALAGNYKSHLDEDAEPSPHPQPFIKLPSSLLRHGGEIVQPADTDPVHYEAEVVVVIGKRARNVSKEAALDHVLGITCGNDISARTWQKGRRAVVAGQGRRHLQPHRSLHPLGRGLQPAPDGPQAERGSAPAGPHLPT